jgi:hypothetical protein
MSTAALDGRIRGWCAVCNVSIVIQFPPDFEMYDDLLGEPYAFEALPCGIDAVRVLCCLTCCNSAARLVATGQKFVTTVFMEAWRRAHAEFCSRPEALFGERERERIPEDTAELEQYEDEVLLGHYRAVSRELKRAAEARARTNGERPSLRLVTPAPREDTPG